MRSFATLRMTYLGSDNAPKIESTGFDFKGKRWLFMVVLSDEPEEDLNADGRTYLVSLDPIGMKQTDFYLMPWEDVLKQLWDGDIV